MDLQTFRVYDEYNKRTNKSMNAILASLSNDQWNQRFGGYFNSVKSLCNHLYICDFNWLKRFSALRDFDYNKNTLFAEDIQFGTTILHTVGEYEEKRKELDDYLSAFIQEIKQEDIGQILTYTDSHGKLYQRLFGGLVLHMFNHQTHHRGMISIYLEEMGINNDYSDLMNML